MRGVCERGEFVRDGGVCEGSLCERKSKNE